MRRSRFACAAVALIVVPAAAPAVLTPAALASSSGQGGSGTGAYVLTATSAKPPYAPTFTGNGVLGVRVPAQGQGFAGGTVPAQSELAGFYAKPAKPRKISDAVQQRAAIPTWSTLTYADGGQAFSLNTGHTTGWRQSIDFRTGVIATSATWTAPDGHVTKLAYQVFTDRAAPAVGVVQLQLTPQWTGTASVADLIDGSPDALTALPKKHGSSAAELTNQVGKGYDASHSQDWVTIQTQGTGITATLASQLATSSNVTASNTAVDQTVDQSVGQQISFPVTAGSTYTITKYVGVGDSQQSADTVAAAQATAAQAAATGYDALLAANDSAWAQLWQGRIDVLGDRTLASDVNASEFYLWSSTRDGVNWSVSPAGLSSNGYDGHIFWDAETWMFPSLLAQHPTLAAAMEAYRYDRLGAAEQHATATGYRGARFPWESALDGTEQIPPPVSTNSEGLYEQHITADIALAQWQYFVTTGDRGWLAQRGWPVLSGAATFWASKAVRGRHGRYRIDHVTGPDEENPNVNQEAYTIVAARTTLIDAIRAARVLGIGHPARWSQIAAGLLPLVNAAKGIHTEFSGYRGQLVKQADVTLLQYPWAAPMSRRLARNDLAYYVPRTDPGGPSMSDAVNSIDTSALHAAGCASFVYTQRSYQPFIRDGFDQFSETSSGGAFTFMTGIGGFLQEFLYGYSGMRLRSDSVFIGPSLTGQLSGIVLNDVAWHGRVFKVSIGRSSTTVTLTSGAPLPISTRGGRHLVTAGRPLRIATARPDLIATGDRVRCGSAAASSFAPGAPALAAVDGSSATPWEPASVPATLTAPVHGSRSIRRAVVIWGLQWPPPPKKPNVPPPPGPVIVRRPTSYSLLVSPDGRRWRRIAAVSRATGTTDTLDFAPVAARFVRVRIASAPAKRPPLLEELSVTG